jgi:FkbM family methyltransferase
MNRETQLPNGKKFYCISKIEANLVYDQIQEYFKHGIELHSGDTVIDVGANIGLFSLWVYWQYQEAVNIYSFEPIPAIFAVLQANIQRHRAKTVQAFPYGVSSSSQTRTFAYHPNASALSTAYPEAATEQKSEFKETILRNLQNSPSKLRILRWFPPFLRSWILDALLNYYFQVDLVSCQLKTLSELIQEHSLQRIDLLKIDVENSELDVLLGLGDSDWPKIKQVVVEVHDREHRLDQVINLLKQQGLSRIAVEQEPLFQGSTLFNVYAIR